MIYNGNISFKRFFVDFVPNSLTWECIVNVKHTDESSWKRDENDKLFSCKFKWKEYESYRSIQALYLHLLLHID